MTQSKRIRVLIADDHTVVRNGLSSFLMAYDDLELVGEARNGEHVIRLCERLLPDVILMDLMMPGMDVASAIRHIRETHPNTRVIALTSYKESELVQSVIQAGAIGYLLKDVTAAELAKAIRLAHAGKPTLAAEAAEVLIEAARQPESKPGDDLTSREREVLALMVEGLDNRQIADSLVVSLSTAKSHVSNVLSKLGVATRTEAVIVALKNRLA